MSKMAGSPDQPRTVRGIAHELNNALAVILNYAAFLDDDLEGRPEQREYVAEIHRAGQRAAELVERLEAADAAPAHESPSAAEAEPVATVLVVDDDDAVGRVTQRILARAGFRVLSASGAEEALAVMRYRGPVDVLITDVVMPGQSGIELAGWVAEISPQTHVLRASGYPKETLLARGMIEAEDDILAKPFTGETLLARVNEAIGNAA